MRKQALCALLLLPCAHAQAPELSTYRNDAFHFSYRYPATFVASTALADTLRRGLAAGPDDADHQRIAKCLSIPFTASKGLDNNQANGFGLIVLLRLDNLCLGETSEPNLGAGAQTLMQLLKGFGKPITEDALDYKLDGRDASFVQGSTAMSGDRVLHSVTTCTVLAKNTFCFLLADSNHKLMPALISNPITIGDGNPTPLIPGDRTQPW